MPNLDFIMDKVADSVERPPLAPLGDYVWQVTKLPEPDRVISSDKGSWDVMEFPVQVVRATDEVDPDLLKAYGDVKNIRARKSFLFTKDPSDQAGRDTTAFQMTEWLTKHLGQDSSMTVRELVNGAVNKQFLGTLKYRADANDKSVQYHELGKTAPLA